MAGPNPLRRKLAIATWRPSRSGNIYGKLTVDATEALAYLDQVRARSGEKVTITHLVGRAVAQALSVEPSLNGRIRFGKFIPHDDVAITFLVAMEDGSDLAKAKVDDADKKGLADVARELRQQAERLRTGSDDDWEKSKKVIRLLPTALLRPLLWVTGWIASSLGVSAPALGVTRFPFGSAIVTSVGMFGLDEGYVPFTPFARVPLYVLIGAVRDAVTVVDGEVTVRPQLTITATIDHRFIDGFQGGVLAQAVRKIFEDPWSIDRAAPAPSPAVTA